MPALDYSRFDHIEDSDDEAAEQEQREQQAQQAQLLQALQAQAQAEQAEAAEPPRPPGTVLDDLEDYFERWDARRSAGADPTESATQASVERFTDEDFAQLERRSSLGGQECAICLGGGHDDQEPAVVLPCAARHAFHEECARAWFERNITCPLCRVDVRELVRVKSPRQPPPSPSHFGFTRDGGVIQRYEPTPPADLPRPAYIPPELHQVAELVEIEYPERGRARVWRVPRG